MDLTIKVFEIEVQRVIDEDALELISEVEADAASDEGYLRGNSRYDDHRGWTWNDVRAVLRVETPLV
ncbi:MAG: hypothetical protein Q8M88_13205, partial [Phenylobacterium sp.]